MCARRSLAVAVDVDHVDHESVCNNVTRANLECMQPTSCIVIIDAVMHLPMIFSWGVLLTYIASVTRVMLIAVHAPKERFPSDETTNQLEMLRYKKYFL